MINIDRNSNDRLTCQLIKRKGKSQGRRETDIPSAIIHKIKSIN